MFSNEEIKQRMKELGTWAAHNINIQDDIWTRPGGENGNESTLKKVMEIIKTTASKPIHQNKILDLGCLEGMYSIELAKLGADCLGIEGRKLNKDRCKFVKEALDLDNLEFILDDVRNVSVEKYGRFDIVLCLGLFYHFQVKDLFPFAGKLFEMCNNMLIIDTCVSQVDSYKYTYQGIEYSGHLYPEPLNAEDERKNWAALESGDSFYLNEKSIYTLLKHVGFKIVFKILVPDIGHKGKYTFVALKGH